MKIVVLTFTVANTECIPYLCINRFLKRSFGMKTNKFVISETTIIKAIVTTTTLFSTGTCVRRHTSTEYGVIQSAELWMHSVLTSGPSLILLFLSLCVDSWPS